MSRAPFAAETLHHEQRNGCTISNGHDAPRPAVSMHHPSRRIQKLQKIGEEKKWYTKAMYLEYSYREPLLFIPGE